jgi:hypothetical protein
MIDACAERSTARTFFSTLFSMTEYSSRTSDSNVSILSNSVTAFFDLTAFFDFMSRSLFHQITRNIAVPEGLFELNMLRVFRGRARFGLQPVVETPQLETGWPIRANYS